jgi:beta-glucosidase
VWLDRSVRCVELAFFIEKPEQPSGRERMRLSRMTVLACAAVSLGAAGRAKAQQVPPYLNPDLPVERRVDDLVGRMTLEEKVLQMTDQAPAIPRLGVPEYNWWNEALHGVARSGLATVFPQAIGMAATWDDSLVFRMASVVGTEARAKHHEYVRRGSRLRYQGLTMFSPNVNIFRDPRWGRGQETYGEDPYLTGRLAVPFVRGLQGGDPRYLKTVATVKHFAVHSGPEPERHAFDARVSERDLRETYLPQFERAIHEGGAQALMCAYNRVEGAAACGSDALLRGILRGEWRFGGFVTSDCWALDDIYLNHKLVATAPEAAAAGLRAGTDLDCGSRVYPRLLDAVRQGLVSEAQVDSAVKRLFAARFRLGMFDPPSRVPYAATLYSAVDQPAHRELARRAARESMVLLKNEGGVLPLQRDLGTLAVIGPNADQWLMLLGNYNGVPSRTVTPLAGLRAAVSPRTRVLYARGADLAEGLPTFDVVPPSAFRTADGHSGLRAEYYRGREMRGAPLFTSADSALDADWHDGAPRADMDPDDFGVRWTGTLAPARSGTYQLAMIATTRFELYVDDSLVLRSQYNYRDEPGDPRLVSAPAVRLEAGRTYRLRVDAHESYGDAQVQLLWSAPQGDPEAEALDAARQADAVVLFLGLSPRLEGEEMKVEVPGFRGGDRTSLDLPATQEHLLERVAALGKPTVLVLLNGSALAVNWAQDHVPAILEAWYPGQAAGTAIADVLFGGYNPAGRLPVTFYRGTGDLPPFEDYAMRGRTYRFFQGRPLYPFGHGLSYTTFRYANLRTGALSIGPGDTVAVSVDVTNTGARDGDEVVQLYVRHPASSVDRPVKELKGFARVHLRAGETRTVRLLLPADELRYWDPARHGWVLERERVGLQVGASSADIRLEGSLDVRPRAAARRSVVLVPLHAP